MKINWTNHRTVGDLCKIGGVGEENYLKLKKNKTSEERIKVDGADKLEEVVINIHLCSDQAYI